MFFHNTTARTMELEGGFKAWGRLLNLNKNWCWHSNDISPSPHIEFGVDSLMPYLPPPILSRFLTFRRDISLVHMNFVFHFHFTTFCDSIMQDLGDPKCVFSRTRYYLMWLHKGSTLCWIYKIVWMIFHLQFFH